MPDFRMEERVVDEEGTARYLWRLSDGASVETVLFAHHAAGQCLSTQTGCAVGCVFCATALRRPARNLSADEIVAQAEAVDRDSRDGGVVIDWEFLTMSGMGEPLLNYDNVVEAGRRLYQWRDLEVVSLTTSGIVPRIHDLARAAVYLQLHISLHATTDETRQTLIPIARKWTIDEVLSAGATFAKAWDSTVVINYLLFDGINDSDDDARRLASMLDPDLFEVHLLLWNEIPGFDFRRISDERVSRFEGLLLGHGLRVKPMPSKGRKIRAGCGQLSASRQSN